MWIEMENELTHGPVMKTMLKFAIPMILGDLLQQCYNIADTLIVGRFLGADALAAVGSAFSLMTFLTSILLGLAMGSGTVFSIRNCILHPVRPERRDSAERGCAGVFRSPRSRDSHPEYSRLRRCRLDHLVSAHTG